MARDRLGSTPRGALARHPADFFVDELYTGGYVIGAIPPPGQLDYLAVGLFNQDSQGRVAKIYGITTANYSGGGNAANFVSGSIANLVGPAASIRPDRGPSQV